MQWWRSTTRSTSEHGARCAADIWLQHTCVAHACLCMFCAVRPPNFASAESLTFPLCVCNHPVASVGISGAGVGVHTAP